MSQPNQPKQVRQAKPKLQIVKPFLGIDIASEETERACIGAVLTNPNSYHKIARIIDDGQAFFFLRHQYIWSAMKWLVDNDMAIDTVTLSHRLQDTGQLAEVGGPAILTQMISECPTSVHAEVYARLVQRTYTRMLIIALGNDIKEAGMSGEEVSVEQILSKIISRVDTAMDSISSRVITTMSDHGNDHLDASEKARKSGDVVMGIPSGIPGLDNVLEGLFPGTYILGARTGNGKTITLSSIALHAALIGKSVMFINTADGDLNTVLATFYGMQCGLPPQMILRRTWNAAQYSVYVDCLTRMDKLRLFIIHQNQMTPRDIWMQANIIQRTHGLDMIVVDYIQRMGVDGDVKVKSEREQLVYISRAMNQIRKQFDIPVLYGAQLLDQDSNDVSPKISHAKGSKNLIEDADVGIAIWHKIESVPEIQYHVQKNRTGHRREVVSVGFSNVTGRVAHKYKDT